MATSAITSATSACSSCSSASAGMNSLDSEDFFNLLVTELQQQDPMEPTDTGDLLAQVSQIRNIELSTNLTDALTQISNQQRTAGASELIGKYVTATITDSNGTSQEISGVVTAVHFDTDGSAALELDTGQTVSADSVTRITSPENATSTTSTATTDSSVTTSTAANKSATTSKTQHSRILPFLSMDGEFHL